MKTEIIGTTMEGSSPMVMARIRADDGFALENAQVSEWDFDVFDLSSETPSVAIFTLIGQTSPLLTTLSTGNGWDLDSVGGNFFRRIAADDFGCVGNKSYRFLWTIHTATFGKAFVSAVVAIISPYGSHAP